MGETVAKKLIDISKHQGDVDFSLVRNAVDGIILREGYRKTIDERFLQYVDGCRKYAIPVYAVYHFLYPLTTNDAIDEAISCDINIKKAGLNRNQIIVFADYEYDSIKNAKKNGVDHDKHKINEITEAFCAAMTKLGYRVGIYTNIDFHKNYYIDAVKEKYPIWLADYSGGPDYPCLVQQYSNVGNIPGIKGNVDLNHLFEESSSTAPKKTALEVIKLADSWLGKNEKDGSYKEIIDIYNSYKGKFPRGLKMQYSWSWCACTWSALAIKLGYTDIMPIEISCGELIKVAKDMGCWIENDEYIPEPGDAILYDWQDSGKGDDVSWPDHIGLVRAVDKNSGYFVTIEGNYNDAVKKRTVSINGRYIRGFIHPKYDRSDVANNVIIANKSIDQVAHEVIDGSWGSGEDRKNRLEANGYNYREVQDRVNEILNGDAKNVPFGDVDLNQPYNKKVVATCKPAAFNDDLTYDRWKTTENLYLRNDAGKNKKAICIMPKDTIVISNGYYSVSGDTPWPYINFIMDGVYYGGFASSKYLLGC